MSPCFISGLYTPLQKGAKIRTEQAADLERLHPSGHINSDELAEFARTVKPEFLIPIHIEYPEWREETLRGSRVEVRKPE